MLLTLIDYATTTVIPWGFFCLPWPENWPEELEKFLLKKLRNLTDDHQILSIQIGWPP